MPSPFPGMDPYLEGYLWPDVHQALAAKIRQQLAPRLRPRYVTRLGLAVLSEDPDEAEVKIMFPDIEVLRARRSEQLTETGNKGGRLCANSRCAARAAAHRDARTSGGSARGGE